ncbi:small acid-soluble spore protein P [Paenibacillus sedimenti]|uniref:Small acid-soluble spore protein P n=1 Tax=Paenibacillus sedimenti TaxID=2770274 RepID=A0A926KUN5_9BACL|nr:small acid-soluble spore protein P [Paenibacillus sedimenti]MBD0384360.1 small acid-soluble spore protein P [Paenibacillus sedimenti]
MSKPTAYSTGGGVQRNGQADTDNNDAPEALSGSKKVKNRNHSKQKQAKGS